MKRKQAKKATVTQRILVGILVGTAAASVLLGLISYLILREAVSVNTGEGMTTAICLLAALCAVTVGSSGNDNKLLSAVLITAVMLFLMIGSAIMFTNGIGSKAWLRYLGTSLGALAGFLINVKANNKRFKRRRTR